MKVLHFILGKANKDRPNGVNQVIAGLCKYSSINGAKIKVIGLASNASKEGEIISRDKFDVIVYSYWSLKLYKEIIKSFRWCDIVHLHGAYNFSNIIVALLARFNKVPYVLTLHNGLAPKMMKLRKRFFDFIIQKKHIENASAIHCLAQEEASEILERCNPKSFIYAPNGVDLEDYESYSQTVNIKSKKQNSNISIGYLGRISEEKNLLNLVKGIEILDVKNIILKIAGPKSKYLKKILSYEASIEIEYVGPKYGNEKLDFISSLDLFVHPSIADVFSIAAMEVLTIGTPLLISRTSKASHFYNTNGFFMCEPTAYGISQGIQDALDRRGEWSQITQNGKLLISQTFNWNSVSLILLKAYMKLV